MTDARMNRRLGAMLALRLEASGLDEVPDARDPRGIRWALGTLLRAVAVGVAAGAESLAKVEKLTASMAGPVRRKLGIRRRVPDTTLRDALCAIEPGDLAPCLRALTRAAHQRKALWQDGLTSTQPEPSGVMGAPFAILKRTLGALEALEEAQRARSAAEQRREEDRADRLDELFTLLLMAGTSAGMLWLARQGSFSNPGAASPADPSTEG